MIPVILDTDIGADIDDTWALAMMLRCPELDVKLITTDWGNTEYRPKIVAKLLQAAGRIDIPVGIGKRLSDWVQGQGPWVSEYDLSSYPGTIHQDGIQALIDTIMTSAVPVTVIGIGPIPNISEALDREPRIAENARFVGMYGSIRVGYDGSTSISAEHNVKADSLSCRKVLSAPWEVTITPLDTCGLVRLTGERYGRILEASRRDPLLGALMENYRIWCDHTHNKKAVRNAARESTILFDTVAVYIASSEDLVSIEELGVRVTDDGYTVMDPTAKTMRCATGWKNLEAFYGLLAERLLWKA